MSRATTYAEPMEALQCSSTWQPLTDRAIVTAASITLWVSCRWGPFELLQLAEALGIEPILTMQWEQSVEDWAE